MMNTIMVTLSSPPINAVTWTWGAIAIYAFTLKSLRSYRQTKGPLARIYVWLGFAFGTGLLFFGLPGFFTQNPHVLRFTYFLADLFVQIALQFATWLVWSIGMRVYTPLRYMLAVTIPLSIAILVTEMTEILTKIDVSVSQSPHLIIYTNQFLALLLKSIIYVLVALPLAFFLLKQVPNQVSRRAKFQSFLGGTLAICVGVAATSNNIFDKGSDTKQSSLSLAVFFTIFLLAQIPRPHRKPTPY